MMKRVAVPRRLLLGWRGAVVLAAAGAICVPAVLACWGQSGSATTWDGAVRDSAGIPIVENFGTPMWREEDSWEFTEVLRVGVLEGEPEYEFGRISGFVVLSDRRIVVADAMAHELRFFSPEGVHEMTLGREGQGPGEFGDGLFYPTVGPGDTLLVFDRGNQRAQVIAPDGTWLDDYSTLPEDGHWFGMVLDAPPSGRLVTYHVPLRQSDGSLADSMDVLLERDLRGAILDTVARIPTYMTSITPGGAGFYYGDMVDAALCKSGLVIGHNYTYRTVWYGSGGAIERIVTLPSERLPITEEDRSVMLGRFDQLLQEYNVPADQAAQIKSGVRFVDHYPAYSQFNCGPAGTLLMQRYRPLRRLSEEERSRIRTNLGRPPGALEWDVFDSEGRYLGVVVVPGTEWVAIVADLLFVQDQATGTWYMYSVWSDELEVQYVIGWRVDGPMPG
ncbi:MAG: hypothetical protein JSV86_14515 [Gemmatimonadota bacterium]|nr:MAG: hypothetical protein JSV86_14515 [Gemmatimonadota bacterium]